jgi:hypothetical protein
MSLLGARSSSSYLLINFQCASPCPHPAAAGTGRRIQLSASGVPPLPYVAPFTCCVPEVLSLVRRYVIDSLAYLRGLHSPQELLPAVLHQRDRMLGKVSSTIWPREITCCDGSAGV